MIKDKTMFRRCSGVVLLGLLLSVCAWAETPPPAPFGPVPSARQFKWHEQERIGMISFSVNTYTGKEWGYGDEPAALFNPTNFDARQIVRTAKSAGLQSLVIVAKHHCGFCLWPSKYTEYSVKNSPWRDGKGDLLKELVDACRAEGLQVGMYLSPWDRNAKDYGRPEYITYFRNQMTELLTQYGPISEVWFDGANGGDGYYGGARETRSVDKRTYYDWPNTFALVRKLQPDANIFSGCGPDLRWVGNERGLAAETCWATFTPKDGKGKTLEINPETGYFREIPIGDFERSGLPTGHRNGQFWMPAEADFPLRRGWFWHPGDRPRSAADLVERYFTTVGRNSTMDIGLAPDRRGLMDDADVASLKGFGERIAAIFKTNLATGANATASNVRGNAKTYAAANAIKGESKFKDYWAADDAVTNAELTLDFGKPTEFSVVSLREPIQLGQRIDRWALDSWQDGQWHEFAAGTGIGAHRLWRGRQPIVSGKIRLRLINASASPAVSEFGIYLEPAASREEVAARGAETGLPHKGWQVVSAAADSGVAQRAIDGDPKTFWHTHTAAGKQPPPQSLVVDMGRSQKLTGFLYLPRQDNSTIGDVTRYAFAVSDDGQAWTEVARGEFGNIAANPVQQKVGFEQPVSARYFKFTGEAALGGCVNAAEIGVVGNPQAKP